MIQNCPSRKCQNKSSSMIQKRQRERKRTSINLIDGGRPKLFSLHVPCSSFPSSGMTPNNEALPAAAVASTTNDATIAEALHAAMTLRDVFGFPGDVVDQTIEAVGVDVTTCYNYILDMGLAQDQGGPIVPINNCPHVEHHVLVTPEQLPPQPEAVPCSHKLEQKRIGSAKGDMEDDGSCPSNENWICLQCGVIRCSRYMNGHGVTHYKTTLAEDNLSDPSGVGHCVAASLSDLSVWCHACRAYVKGPIVGALTKKLEELKFPTEKTKG